MHNEIPDLDTKSFEDLVQSMISIIPTYTNNWTNFNQSDPGITLIELLCWICKTLLYRLDRIPANTYLNFLRLIAGATGNEIDTLLQELTTDNLDQDYINLLLYLKKAEKENEINESEIQTHVLTFFKQPFLAITHQNFEQLTSEANRLIEEGQPNISRAIVRPHTDQITIIIICNREVPVNYFTPPYPANEYGGSYTTDRLVTIGYRPAEVSGDYYSLTQTVTQYLTSRLLLGSIINVIAPVITPVNIIIFAVVNLHFDMSTILNTLTKKIQDFLNPLTGGQDGKGWPYDQAPTETDISKLTAEVSGIEKLASITITFIPTVMLNNLATLDANTVLLQSLPIGYSHPVFKGLPLLRVLDISVSTTEMNLS